MTQIDHNLKSRRTFLKTTGSILLGSTVGLSGCLGDSVSGGPGSSSIPIDIDAPEDFDGIAVIDSTNIETTPFDDDDGFELEMITEVPEEPNTVNNACINLEKTFILYDEDDVVLSEYTARQGYDAGETYREEYSFPESRSEIDHIVLELDHEPLSAICHL